MFADVLVKHVVYDQLFYVGSVPMFLSFFIVAVLTHYDNWDPILEALVYLLQRFKRLVRCGGSGGGGTEAVVAEAASHEAEALITNAPASASAISTHA